MIPNNIELSHVLMALQKIDRDGIQVPLAQSRRHDLLYKSKRYPPKYTISLANEFANNEYLTHSAFDTYGAQRYLEALSPEFTIVPKDQDAVFELVQQYKTYVKARGLDNELYKWELLSKYQGKPDLSSEDFSAEVRSIDYSNLIYPIGIGVIKQLAADATYEYRNLLLGLFDDAKELDVRIQEFTDGVKGLYDRIKTNARNGHQHDERTIATLLTYHNPDKYAFFKDSFYQKYCKTIGVKSKEKGKKYSHYMELLSDFIEEYIIGDLELLELIDGSTNKVLFKDRNRKLLAQDILYQTLDLQIGKKRNYWRIGTTTGEPSKISYWDDMYSQQFVSIGWSDIGDLTDMDIKTKKEIEPLLLALDLYVQDKRLLSRKSGEIFNFYSEIRQGDIVVAQDGFKIQGIGIVDGDYTYWDDGGFSHQRSVKWSSTPPDFKNEEGKLTTVYKLSDPSTISKIDRFLEIENNKNMEPHIIPDHDQPLNQILYGPPGTGKTYTSINKAISIIKPKFDLNQPRDIIKKEFDNLVTSGQIVFTTFHQSMSYEDFIEGIKPMEPKEGDKFVKYEIQPGIFKSICDSAKQIESTSKGLNWGEVDFYKMSLGGKNRPDIHEWCIANDVIALGYGGEEDLSKYKDIKSWTSYRDTFSEEFPELVKNSRYNIQSAYIFQKMKINDVVVISKGNHIIDAIGVVKGEYFWDNNNEFDYFHFRKVEWIAKNINTSPDRFFKKQVSQQTIYEFYKDDVKIEAFEQLSGTPSGKINPYVLIIDEINRGNVSQIFGELITLIEEDKRKGKPEALEIMLPYSKEKFSVPDNLYIIGTMNTADRSVEALDSALRRRFSFEEILPDYRLLNPYDRLGNAWSKFWFIKGRKDEAWVDELNIMEDQILRLADLEIIQKEYDAIWTSWGEEDYGKWIKDTQYETVFKNMLIEGSNGIRLDHLLMKINKRIDLLLDKDYQIGHSYFISVGDRSALKILFEKKIIPLLQEYFFGDFGKIGLVLGEGFFEKSEKTTNYQRPFAKFMDYPSDAFEGKTTYKLKDVTKMNDVDFNKAIVDLLA